MNAESNNNTCNDASQLTSNQVIKCNSPPASVTYDVTSDQCSEVSVPDANNSETSTPLNSMLSDFESIPNIENKDCEYLKLVMAFKRTLVLPDVFFSYDVPVCYCTLCASNGDRNLLKGRQAHT